MGIDNINIRNKNKLAIHEATYEGFDGIATQALNPNENYDFLSYVQSRPLSERLPVMLSLEDKRKNRNCFLEDNFPTQQDKDIVAFRYLACGLAISNRNIVISVDPSIQRSYRSLLMDSLEGIPVGKGRVEYVDISQGKFTEVELIERLEMIKAAYNPKEERKNAEDYVFVAVHGDQPIFKMLFRFWYRSYIELLQMGAKLEVDQTANNLCRWLVPLPGGFHADKQGLIPLIKDYMKGSGIEELLLFSGMSKNLQKVFQKCGHYRMNRRYLVQIMIAMILRISDSLSSISQNYSRTKRECMTEIDEESKLSDDEKKVLWEGELRRDAQLKFLPKRHQVVNHAFS